MTRRHQSDESQPSHRSPDEIREEMRRTPLQGIPALQAELEAALAPEPEKPTEEE